ncbi:hypothetical protein AB0H18_26690 [Streptomyces sp. NPDC020766]|uniref:hypothetical protein n=1 Tax=Streptomyces sp. NPDC020766 TaxID=3155011 RepID=UPI00340DB090
MAAAYRDADCFRSDRGNVLDTLLGGGDAAAGLMLPLTEGARHADLRGAFMKAFSPRALSGVGDSVRAASRELLTDLPAKGECGFAQDVAGRLPLRAICDLLDVPQADRQHLLDMTSSALGSESEQGLQLDSWVSESEILLCFSDLVAQRRRDLQDDIVSLLRQVPVEGVPLTDEEVVLNCYSLIVGGDETTRLALVGGVAAFLGNPAQWAAYRSGGVPTGPAVEDVLHTDLACGPHGQGRVSSCTARRSRPVAS